MHSELLSLRRCSWLYVAMLLVGSLTMVGCEGGRSELEQPAVDVGNPAEGAKTIRAVGCGSCHVIPGIDGAEGTVGPPLNMWSKRSYIAGNLPNSPGNLTRWIMNAQSVEPGTAMPELDLSREEARNVAAYLYTLE